MPITAAIETGQPTRRIRGRRTLLAGTAALAAVAAAALSASAAGAETAEPVADPAACDIAVLPMPGDTYFSIVTGMSDDGSAIAYRAYPVGLEGEERYPMVYLDGEAHKVSMPGTDQTLTDINSSGTAVGSSWVDDLPVTYVWEDDVLTRLTDKGTAAAINENGDIVGSVEEDGSRIPVIWPAGETEPVGLAVPEGTVDGWASAVEDDGTVVGALRILIEGTDLSVSTPYLWHPDCTGERLPVPEVVGKEDFISTADINGDWVIGNLFTPTLEAGVRWNLADGTVEVLDILGAFSVDAEGTASGDLPPAAGYQTADGELVELPGVTDPVDNWFGDIATEIDTTGDFLAGQVFAGEDEYGMHILKAVTWTCE